MYENTLNFEVLTTLEHTVELSGRLVSAIVKAVLGGTCEMKRKIQTKAEPVVPAEMLEQAKRAFSPDRLKKVTKCSVCSAETASIAASEPLCWVCRRLKISAWRDVEQQMPIQE